MPARSLTCRCRFCGYVLCYTSEDTGSDARCPQCGQDVRLPGELARVATLRRTRIKNSVGLALEAGGFLCMFFFPPWGMIAGAVIVVVGWRKCHALTCSNCRAIIRNASAESCPACRTKLGRE